MPASLGKRKRWFTRPKIRNCCFFFSAVGASASPLRFEQLETRQLLAAGSELSIVADYRDDFRAELPLANGWQYLWNAPEGWQAGKSNGDLRTGAVGNPTSYQTLVDAGKVWTPDGDSVNNRFPDRALRLHDEGGRPGAHAGAGRNAQDRYAIAAYTVTEAGFYSITDSFLTRPNITGDGIEVVVHVNDNRPILVTEAGVGPEGTTDFNTKIGFLEAGDTIYVAFGPGQSSKRDGFETDFSIAFSAGQTIQQQIDQALADGQSSVRIQPGTYYITPSAPTSPHLRLKDVSNLEIDATDVKVVARGLSSALQIRNSHNIQVRGLTIDYDPLPFTQGTIVDQADNGSWVDVEIHAGYPTPNDPTTNRILIHDAETGLLKPGSRPRSADAIEALGGDRYRIDFGRAHRDSSSVGDSITIRRETRVPFAVQLEQSTHVTLQSVNIQASPHIGVNSRDGSNHQLIDVQIAPGPQPLLAEHPRLRSINGTGIRSINDAVGPRIERVTIESSADDGVNIQGEYGLVAEATKTNQVTVVMKRDLVFQVGNRIRFYHEADHTIVERVVTAIAPADIPATELAELRAAHLPRLQAGGRYHTAFTLTFDEPVQLTAGDFASNPGRSGSGYAVLESTVRNTPSVGLRLRGSAGLVDANRVEHTFRPAILVAAEPETWGEADFSRDLTISNNQIVAANLAKPLRKHPQAGALTITTDANWSANGHRNLTIRDNRFEEVVGVNLQITHASQVQVTGNRFIQPHQQAGGHGDLTGIDPTSVVWLDQVDTVHFEGNQVEQPGLFGNADRLLVATDTAVNVTGTISIATATETETETATETNDDAQSAVEASLNQLLVLRDDSAEPVFTALSSPQEENERLDRFSQTARADEVLQHQAAPRSNPKLSVHDSVLTAWPTQRISDLELGIEDLDSLEQPIT